MKFLISGGTGFIGSALCDHLSEQGHQIVVKTRKPESIAGNMIGIDDLNQLATDTRFDVVINLTGEPIANKRWTKKQKQKIVDSRINTTKELIEFLKNIQNKPALFISGSAIGYYGLGIGEVSNEKCSGDKSFSSQLCRQWEGTALQAESLGIRTCLLRTGIVLGHNGGVLNKMLFPFKMGLGGRMGTGEQWMSWIHIDDMIRIIDYCIEHDDIKGPINCTAPCPVTNQVFTKELAKCLGKPAFLPIPAIAIKLLMGEMGNELLLNGNKVLPAKLEQLGFKFKFERLENAFSALL